MTAANELIAAAERRCPAMDVEDLYRVVEGEIEVVERYAGGATASETFLHQTMLPAIVSVIRPIASITSIAERWRLQDAATTLHATDYRLADPWRVVRLDDGVHPASTWGREVVVSYTPVLDQQLRDRIVLDLVELSAKFTTLRRERIADDVEMVDGDYAARRDELLRQLSEGRARVF